MDLADDEWAFDDDDENIDDVMGADAHVPPSRSDADPVDDGQLVNVKKQEDQDGVSDFLKNNIGSTNVNGPARPKRAAPLRSMKTDADFLRFDRPDLYVNNIVPYMGINLVPYELLPKNQKRVLEAQPPARPATPAAKGKAAGPTDVGTFSLTGRVMSPTELEAAAKAALVKKSNPTSAAPDSATNTQPGTTTTTPNNNNNSGRPLPSANNSPQGAAAAGGCSAKYVDKLKAFKVPPNCKVLKLSVEGGVPAGGRELFDRIQRATMRAGGELPTTMSIYGSQLSIEYGCPSGDEITFGPHSQDIQMLPGRFLGSIYISHTQTPQVVTVPPDPSAVSTHRPTVATTTTTTTTESTAAVAAKTEDVTTHNNNNNNQPSVETLQAAKQGQDTTEAAVAAAPVDVPMNDAVDSCGGLLPSSDAAAAAGNDSTSAVAVSDESPSSAPPTMVRELMRPPWQEEWTTRSWHKATPPGALRAPPPPAVLLSRK